MMDQELPRILFIGAVTFEEISGSHSFFYRLFKGYPPDKLVVVGSHKARNPIFPSKRLPGVNYVILEEQFDFKEIAPVSNNPFSILRFYYQTLKQIVKSYCLIRQVAKSFQPDLILTLSMDYYWYLAYRLSKSLDIPLELVLHDRWEATTLVRIAIRLYPQFKKVYQYAQHRFCISPSMESYYYNQLSMHGDILYPISRKKAISCSLARNKKPLTVVFFGNIWYHLPTLIDLAHLLSKQNIELVIFSNRNLEFFQSRGLKTSNVTAHVFWEEHDDLLNWCQENVDILYLPMHFDNYQKQEIQCSFPSKIADYTSLGLPVIIHAPRNSSVVEFAAMNAGYPFAEVVTSDSEDELAAAIDRLTDVEYRKRLGRNSLYIWHQFFDPEVVRKSFFEKLSIEITSKGFWKNNCRAKDDENKEASYKS